MKKIINLALIAVLLVGMLLASTGCASYLSYKSSYQEICRNRVIATGDKGLIQSLSRGVPSDQVIKLIPMRGEGVGLAFDLSPGFWDSISEHPIRQVGAAVLDGGTAWAAYSLIRDYNSSSSDSGTDIDVTSGGDTTITIGNGNNDEDTTTTNNN